VPQGVSQYLEFVNNLVFELEVQGGLTKGVHDDVQKINMRAQGLMDDQINNLKLAHKKLVKGGGRVAKEGGLPKVSNRGLS
jgi:hypothetical protein